MSLSAKQLEVQVSVIIPTRHRDDLLAKCLDRLVPGFQTLPAHMYEVIVTDDGSGPTAERMIQEHYSWAKWVAGPRKGPAANRNTGARLAQGEWLAFTDDDCLPDSRWLDAYLSAIQADVDVYEGKTTCEAGIHSPLEIAPINHTGGPLWSCNIMVRRTAFLGLGGFDESFPDAAGEDVEFRERIKRLGYKYPFVVTAIVDHPPRREPPGWKQGARMESQVRLWHQFSQGAYFPKQLLGHVKYRVQKVFDCSLSLDSFRAIVSLVTELAYVIPRIRKWEKKYYGLYRRGNG